MKAGSSMRPQKAQVKDKGLGTDSGDMRLEPVRISRFSFKELGQPLKMSFGTDWQTFHKAPKPFC